jgi:hypothetical protein
VVGFIGGRQTRHWNNLLPSDVVGAVKDRQKLPVSIMLPGLLEALPERKVLELLKYLLSRRG